MMLPRRPQRLFHIHFASMPIAGLMTIFTATRCRPRSYAHYRGTAGYFSPQTRAAAVLLSTSKNSEKGHDN